MVGSFNSHVECGQSKSTEYLLTHRHIYIHPVAWCISLNERTLHVKLASYPKQHGYNVNASAILKLQVIPTRMCSYDAEDQFPVYALSTVYQCPLWRLLLYCKGRCRCTAFSPYIESIAFDEVTEGFDGQNCTREAPYLHLSVSFALCY